MHASIRLVERMLDKRDKLYPGNGSCTFTGLQQQIRFHNVWFRYPDSTRPSLTHATFSIPAGKRTAIVGPSGAGKTTIVNLMLRLLDPDQGSISVDGVDLAELNRIDWLKHIAVAGQDVDLIEGTVRENITLVCPDVSDRKIAEAVRLAGIEEFIATLPDGFDEWIGDYGLNVSGGQRQRIGLARALVSEPEILILDEATSALDGVIESQIRQRIWRKYGNRTLIVITHRLATIETMDHVICLNSDGQVAEQGAPDVLLSSPDSALAQRVLQENNDADPEPLLTGQIQSF
jgi:ABC-type multidrug transport system fused ATPase/permease subunit